MLDVHPPEHTPHSWRDFLIHIATIVVGLLIAIGLEQSVEAMHHRHQRLEAEENLRGELQANRQILANDMQQLTASRGALNSIAQILMARRAERSAADLPHFGWRWDDLESAAWETARSTQTVGLMRYKRVQELSDVYAQQGLVNAQSAVYIADSYRIVAPMLRQPAKDLTAAEVNQMLSDVDRSASDLAYLMDLCRSLQTIYNGLPEKD